MDKKLIMSFGKKVSAAVLAAASCLYMSVGVMPFEYVLADEIPAVSAEDDGGEEKTEETEHGTKAAAKDTETKPSETEASGKQPEETEPEETEPEETEQGKTEPSANSEEEQKDKDEKPEQQPSDIPSETSSEAPERSPDDPAEDTPSQNDPEAPAETPDGVPAEVPQETESESEGSVDEYKYTLSGKGYLPKYKAKTGKFSEGELVIGQKGKRLEAFSIALKNDTGYEGSITYRAYSKKKGWSKWVASGKVAGTKKKNLRIEAVQIKLTGELAKHYFVEYKATVSTFGDSQGWVNNGTIAGTMYSGNRLEQLQIRLVPFGKRDSSSVVYRLRGQTYGWQKAWCSDGKAAGTFSKRVEAITISLGTTKYTGGITYRTYIQDGKWTAWASAGAMSGNSKTGKRIECIQIKLTGEMAEHYDVYYRVYSPSFGWLDWAVNGQASGTTGCFCRIDKIQIVLREKGSGEPGNEGGIESAKEHAYYAASNTNAIMTYKNILSSGYTDPDEFRKKLIKNFEYMDGVGYFHAGKMVQGYTDCAGSVSLAFRVALGTAKFTKKYKKGTLENGKQLYAIGVNYCGITSYKDKFGWCRNGTASVNSHFLNTIIKNRKIKYSQVSLNDRSDGVHGWSNAEWIDYLNETGAKPGDVFVWYNHDWSKTKGQHMTMYAGIGEDGIAYEWTASSTYGVILSPLADRTPQNIFESFVLFKGVADVNGYY